MNDEILEKNKLNNRGRGRMAYALPHLVLNRFPRDVTSSSVQLYNEQLTAAVTTSWLVQTHSVSLLGRQLRVTSTQGRE